MTGADTPPLMGTGQPLVLSYGPAEDQGGNPCGDRWRINIEPESIAFQEPYNPDLGPDQFEQAQTWASDLLAHHTQLRVRTWTTQIRPDGSSWCVATLDRLAVHLTVIAESGRTHRLWNLTPARATTILASWSSDPVIAVPALALHRPDEELMGLAHESAQGGLLTLDQIAVLIPTGKIESVVQVTGTVPYDDRRPGQG